CEELSVGARIESEHTIDERRLAIRIPYRPLEAPVAMEPKRTDAPSIAPGDEDGVRSIAAPFDLSGNLTVEGDRVDQQVSSRIPHVEHARSAKRGEDLPIRGERELREIALEAGG